MMLWSSPRPLHYALPRKKDPRRFLLAPEWGWYFRRSNIHPLCRGSGVTRRYDLTLMEPWSNVLAR
jgi:hypothetical protein